jgi:DNA-binding transcriptional LysR family regulator
MLGRVNDVDLRLLRVFVAIVDAGGFSLATAKLNIAESSISQHMSDLETRLGLRLCERGRGGFRLTANGETVYKLAVDILTEVEHFRDRVASVGKEVAGTLRLGLPDAIITHEDNPVTQALAQYLGEHPDMTLNVEMAMPRDLERGVVEGKLHLALAPEHRRIGNLRFLPLFSERNTLYCGRLHPLFDVPDSRIDSDVLDKTARIARGYLDRFDAQFFSEAFYRATVHQVEAAAMLIRTGQCIGFLPDHYAAAWVDQGEMRALRPDTYTFTAPFGVIMRPEGENDPKVALLVAALEQASQEVSARKSIP